MADPVPTLVNDPTAAAVAAAQAVLDGLDDLLSRAAGLRDKGQRALDAFRALPPGTSPPPTGGNGTGTTPPPAPSPLTAPPDGTWAVDCYVYPAGDLASVTNPPPDLNALTPTVRIASTPALDVAAVADALGLPANARVWYALRAKRRVSVPAGATSMSRTVTTDDGCRLFAGADLVLDRVLDTWKQQGPTVRYPVTVAIPVGKTSMAETVEWYQAWGGATLTLTEWAFAIPSLPPSQPPSAADPYASPLVGAAGQVDLAARPDWQAALANAARVAPGPGAARGLADALAAAGDTGAVVLQAGAWRGADVPFRVPARNLLLCERGATIDVNGASGLPLDRLFNAHIVGGRPGGQGAVVVVPAGATVDQLDLEGSDAFGVQVYGHAAHALAHGCARLGFAGWQAGAATADDNLGLLTDCEAFACGTAMPWWSGDGEAAGAKFVQTGTKNPIGVKARRIYVHDMPGVGWWYDIANRGDVIEDFLAERCDGPGLMVEISGSPAARITGRRIRARHCGLRGTGTVGVQAAQVLVVSSQAITLTDLDVTADAGLGGIVALNDGRGPGLADVTILDAVQRLDPTSFTGWTGGGSVRFAGSTFPGLDPAAKVFLVNGSRADLAAWKAAGMS